MREDSQLNCGWRRGLVVLSFGILFLASAGYVFGQYSMPTSLNPFESPAARVPKTISSFSLNVPVPLLALTFDDGPHPKHTPKLLDILNRYGVRATFFVVGKNVEKYPEIAQRIVAEGHQIANHTMTHPNLVKLKRKRFDKEIKETSTLIEAYTGKRPTVIRPPYGSLNAQVEALLKNLYGLSVILWSVDPEDWKKPGASEVARRLVSGARPGAILLAHDIHGDTVDAMPEVLSQLLSLGYRFGTIDQLMSLPQVPAVATTSLSSQLPSSRPGTLLPPPVGALPKGQVAPQMGGRPVSGAGSIQASSVSGYKVPVMRAQPVN